MSSKIAMTAAAIGAILFLAAAPAEAQRGRGGGWHGGGYHGGGWHRGGGGWGWGAGAGFAAGALLGGALAARPYYYYGPGYAYEPAPAYGPDDAEAYCMQRFRSYDPASGTYLGYDGLRHPCP